MNRLPGLSLLAVLLFSGVTLAQTAGDEKSFGNLVSSAPDADASGQCEAFKRSRFTQASDESRKKAQSLMLNYFLVQQTAQPLRLEKDEARRQTRLIGQGNVLVKLIKLEPRP